MLSSRPAAPRLDARTPARSVLKSRTALQENAQHSRVPFTAHPAKKVQTPFHTSHPPRTSKSKSTLKPPNTTTRPLLDKTPFPNRTSKLTPFRPPSSGTSSGASSARPSTTRKHPRVPPNRAFETPAASAGNPWDVSDLPDISVVLSDADRAIVEEDYSEIEYMPPTAVQCPYKPPFDVPDYKTLGSALRTLPCSFPVDDTPIVTFNPADEEELAALSGPSKWDTLTLPELEDDSPFDRPSATKAKVAAPRDAAPSSRAASASRPRSVPVPSAKSITATRAITTHTRAPSSVRALTTTTAPTTASSSTRPAVTTRAPSAPPARPFPSVSRTTPAVAAPRTTIKSNAGKTRSVPASRAPDPFFLGVPALAGAGEDCDFRFGV